MSTSTDSSRTEQLHFEDNALLPLLFGFQDRNLQRIENALNVTINYRGNHVALSGPDLAVTMAKSVLTSLYKRIQKGHQLDNGEIDAAIRMMQHQHDHPDQKHQGPGFAPMVTRKRQIQARSGGQAEYIKALAEAELVLGIGPAGTGKTYLAVAQAVTLLLQGKIDRIILTRPAVEAGERLGFLPGDLKDKIDPYLRPLYDALFDMLPPEQVTRSLESGEIEVAPLAFMRGRTLSNAFVILDEAQNTTPTQMKMFLTRLGENSRMAVTGDLSQIDLPMGAKSGLNEAVRILEHVDGVKIVRFTEADVVRHPMVTKVLRAYAKWEGQKLPGTEVPSA